MFRGDISFVTDCSCGAVRYALIQILTLPHPLEKRQLLHTFLQKLTSRGQRQAIADTAVRENYCEGQRSLEHAIKRIGAAKKLG